MSDNATTVVPAAEIPAGFMKNDRGHYVPVAQIPPAELLEDQLVKKVFAYGYELAGQIARFKGHTFDDCATFLDLLAEQHGITKRGLKGKGNVTFKSFEGLLRVQIQVQDQIYFGPGLQVAKTAIDECLRSWSADARTELQAVITETFKTDKEGQVSRAGVFSLLRMQIEDSKWQDAMRVLRESIRTQGSKTYIRIQYRRDSDGGWNTLSIDLASAEVPGGMAASHVPAAAPEGGA